ncbi:MAG: V-type ATPase subunit [Eubacterium sp.]|nr:V-type ATPase subunit [Eubacterium sp.]
MRNGRLTTYSGMTTKIRAMKKGLISPAQYEEITRITSVRDLISYLQTFPAYSEVLSNLDAGQAHRGEVEGRMTFSTYHDFSKIYHFAGNSQKRYLEFYFMKYEIATLKACMRNIMDCRTTTIPILVDKHFKRHSKLNIDNLITSKTMEDFIENLNGSVYEKPMKTIMNLDNPRLFDYEMSLDLFFFIYIWNHQEHFVPKGEKKIFTNSFGAQVDLLNILWIYRMKHYYTVSYSQIYAFLIPIYYNLDRSTIKSFVESENDDVFFTLLNSCYYGRVFGFNEVEDMETQFAGILHEIYAKDFKESPYSLSCINAYLHLKSLEVAKVVTAMECIRYGYKPDDISHYINRKKGVL